MGLFEAPGFQAQNSAAFILFRATVPSSVFAGSLRNGLVMLKILYRFFVLLSCCQGGEGAEIAAITRLRVFLSRIDPVFTGF